MLFLRPGLPCKVLRDTGVFLVRFGGDLLSHVLRRSTIGATALNFRVRDGIGCLARAVATKPEKKHASAGAEVYYPGSCSEVYCDFWIRARR